MLKWLIAGLFPALLGISTVGQLPALAAAPVASVAQGIGYPAAPATAPGQSATLMPDGRWLVLGSESRGGKAIARAMFVSPDGKPQLVPGHLFTGRTGHSATLLPDGTVLIIVALMVPVK